MIILPTVMPGEFVLGYWGRIHILNLFGTPNQTAEALIDYFALPPSRIRRIEALALSAQTSTQQFVQDHTLIPAQSAITYEFSEVRHGSPRFEARIKHSWKLAQKSGAYFCPECAEEQRSRWGFSCWQRECQLRGVSWCLKHFLPLLGGPENAFATTTPNITLVTNSTPAVKLGTPSWAVLERYSEIMAGFLKRNIRAGMNDVGRTVRLVAARKSIYTGASNGCELLSDIAVKQLPRWWLEELFPLINTKQLGKPFYSLDNTVLNRYAQPHSFALAMALLYESSEEALASMPQ